MRAELVHAYLGQQAQFTGNTTERNVLGNKFTLGFRARLLDVRASATVQAGGTALIAVFKGGGVGVGASVLSADMTLTPAAPTTSGAIADKTTTHEAGSVFSLTEETSAHTVDALSVDLYFQQMQALPEW